MTRPAAVLALAVLAALPATVQAAPLGNVAVKTANTITRSAGDAPFSSSVRLLPGWVRVSSDAVSRRASCPPRVPGMPRWRASRGPQTLRCSFARRTRVWSLSASYVLRPRADRSRLTVTVRGV